MQSLIGLICTGIMNKKSDSHFVLTLLTLILAVTTDAFLFSFGRWYSDSDRDVHTNCNTDPTDGIGDGKT